MGGGLRKEEGSCWKILWRWWGRGFSGVSVKDLARWNCGMGSRSKCCHELSCGVGFLPMV